MPAAEIPPLNPAWRTSPDDRDIVRRYAGAAIEQGVLFDLTYRMNEVAELSPAAVVTIQGWIDEAEALEAADAAKVTAGTAHLGSARRYEGPIGGVAPARDDQQTKLDVIEWDSRLQMVKTESDGSPAQTESGQRWLRIDHLRMQVIEALGIRAAEAVSYTMPLERN